MLSRDKSIGSWQELHQRIQDAVRFAKPWELSDKIKQDGEHVSIIIERLASLSSLNATNVTNEIRDNAIDFAEAFLRPSHYFFALSATQNGLVAGEVGRLISGAILSAARAVKQRKTRMLLIIDEWQEMVTRDLEILLSQARGLGVGVVLANQTTSQLIRPDCDMRSVVEGNVSLMAWMQVTDTVGRDQLQRLGGEEVIFTFSQTNPGYLNSTITINQSIRNRVSGNLVSAIGSDQGQFLLRLTDNVGYACYGDMIFAAKSMYHQTKRSYEEGCAMPWPSQTTQTLENVDVVLPSAPPSKGVGSRTHLNPPSKGKRSNRLGSHGGAKNKP